MSNTKKQIPSKVVISIKATFNNTIISISDVQGNVLFWESAGSCGFKGARKSTSHAAQVVAEKVARKAADAGVREAFIKINGPGAGRESSIRAVSNIISITEIIDITSIPHNGCRPPKKRHV